MKARSTACRSRPCFSCTALEPIEPCSMLPARTFEQQAAITLTNLASSPGSGNSPNLTAAISAIGNTRRAISRCAWTWMPDHSSRSSFRRPCARGRIWPTAAARASAFAAAERSAYAGAEPERRQSRRRQVSQRRKPERGKPERRQPAKRAVICCGAVGALLAYIGPRGGRQIMRILSASWPVARKPRRR